MSGSEVRHHEVIIVGAGPAGLAMANMLGKSDISTLLVEANASTVHEPRAVSIDDESLRVLQNMDLLEQVERDIVQGYGSEYFAPNGAVFLKVHPRAQPYGHPRRNAFRQPLLEAQLLAGLSRYPSVETRFCCSLNGFQQDPSGVTVDLLSVAGERSAARALFVIGCDGARSVIRQQLGIALAGSSLDERWLIVDLSRSPAPSTETMVFCDVRRAGIALPGPHMTRRFEFKLHADEKDADMLTEQRVHELLERHGAAPGSIIVRKTVYHFHARIAERWGQGRVWLAGDAAHLMPPFAGQGMNSAIRDASNLAWKLAYILRGRLAPGVLETYEAERRGHVRRMIQLALRMGAIMGPATRLHGALTRATFRALGLWPAARDYFAEMKYKPAPRYDGGFLLSSQLTRKGLVGRMLPQPILQTGPLSGQRLDTALGDGFTLLGIDIDATTLAALPIEGRARTLLDKRVALPLDAVPSLANHAGHLLWIRPDRYVMAESTLEDFPATLMQITQLCERPESNI